MLSGTGHHVRQTGRFPMNTARSTARLARLGLALLLCVLCMLCGNSPSAWAAESGSAAVAHAFGAVLPESAVLVVDPDSRAIEALRGLRVPVGQGQAAAAGTRDWMMASAAVFGLDPVSAGLEVDRVERLADGRTRVTLRQLWRGLPVSGADARAVVSAAGELRYLASTLGPVAPDAHSPAVSREHAVTEAARATGADLSRVPARERLVIRRARGVDRLAWEVLLERVAGLPVEVWVGAVDGEAFEVDAGIARAVGLAYPTDPRADFAEVALERLLPAEGLASHLLAIEDQGGPKVTPLAPGDYRYPPGEGGFEQVNAYWHGDRFLHEYLGSLGYAGPPESLIVRVHAPLEPNVAVTSGRFVHLGRAISGFTRDAALSHDLIYHELVHAVLYGKDVQPGGVRREAGALHEALADYFAAATTGDPAIGEWAYLNFPNGATRVDMPQDTWNAAHYDQVSYAAAPIASVWANSMILSSALWDLRSSIGPACDSLVLEALDFLPTVPTWPHFANALLQADEEFHDERFRSAITLVLSRRGIRGAAVAAFSGPTQLDPGQVGEFRAEPCCGEVLGRYQWWAQAVCRGARCGDWRWLGSDRTLRTGFDDESILELRVETPWGDTLRSARRIASRVPSLQLGGPSRVVEGAVGAWTARAVGVDPVRVTWQRWWRRANDFYRVIGEGSEQSFVADTSFTLVVTARDGLGRKVQQVFEVETYLDKPPSLATGVFRVGCVLPLGARSGEVRLELVRDDPLRIEVLDVLGRLRAVLTDGPTARGAHVLRFDVDGFAPGVYLLRVRQGNDHAVLRFAVVR